MKLIEKLCGMIEEEMEDAERYARCALTHKEEDRELSDAFARLSEEEMGHADILHKQVVRFIEAYRRKSGDPPPSMMAVYEYLHKKQIDHAAEIRVMQGMFRG